MWGNNGVKFSPPERRNFALRDFTGGICNTKSPLKIKDNQCVDMLNISFEQDGILKKRSGIRNSGEVMPTVDENGLLLNTFVLEIGQNQYGYLMQGTDFFVYYTGNPDDTGDVNRKFIPWNRNNSLAPVQGAQFLNKFYFVDGGGSIMYFELTELETLEQPNFYHIVKPPVGFTPLPNPAVKGVNKTEVMTGQTYPHYKVWYEPCALELEDGFKGANMCEMYPTFLQVHGDRLYVAGNTNDPNMIYISDVLNPLYFPASLPIQTPPIGDRITGLHIFSDALIIGRRDSVYALFGNTNRLDATEPYSLKHINTHTGIANQNCSNVAHSYLFYVGSDGQCYKITSVKGDATQIASTQLNKDFDFTTPPLNKTVDDIRKCHTGFDPVRGEWYIQIGEETVVYNYNMMAWTRYNNMTNIKLITIDNKFYIIKENGSFNIFDNTIHYDVIQFYGDMQIPINCYWKSKTIDFNDPTRVKQIRDTYLVSESWDGNVSDVMINYKIDYVPMSKQYSITNEVPYWDKAVWDVSQFVGENIIRSLPIMVGRRGKTLEVEIRTPYEYIGAFNALPGNPDTTSYSNGALARVVNGINGLVDGWYIKGDYNLETGGYWTMIPDITYFYQPLKIYELSGIYELKGYR